MKNYNKSALQSANRSKAIIIAIMLAIIIAASAILGVGFGVYGTDASTWFKAKDDVPVVDQNPDPDDIIVSDDENTNSVMRLRFGKSYRNADGTASQDIVATLNSSEGVQSITWTLAWQNASSAFASGKSVEDYMTLTASDDTKTAHLTCSKAFGEPIVVTATSDDNADASASAKLDYIKRITKITFPHATEAGEFVKMSGFLDYNAEDTEYYNNVHQYQVEYGVGTVEGTVSFSEIQLFSGSSADGNTKFISDLGGKVIAPNNMDKYMNINIPSNNAVKQLGVMPIQGNKFVLSAANLFTYKTGVPAEVKRIIEVRLNNLLVEYGAYGLRYPLLFGRYVGTYTSPNGTQIQALNYECPFFLNPNVYKTIATVSNVTVDQTQLYF